MGKFTPSIQREVMFEGEKIRYTLRRITNAQMMSIAPAMIDIENEGPRTKAARIVMAGKPVMQECVTDFSGLTDSTGKPVSFEVVLIESYFLRLAELILTELLAYSTMTEEDAKKLLGPLLDRLSGESASPLPSAES